MAKRTQHFLTKADLDAELKKQSDPATRSAKLYAKPLGGLPGGLSVLIFPGNDQWATFNLFFRALYYLDGKGGANPKDNEGNIRPAKFKAYKYRIGRYPSLGIADARKKAQQVLHAVASGENPAELHKAALKAGEAVTAGPVVAADAVPVVVASFVEKHCKAKGRRSWRETERVLNKHFVVPFGQRPLSSIKRKEIIEILDGIAVTSPIQANRVLAAIRKMFNWALNRDIIESTPCAGIEQPGLEQKRSRTLSDDELRAIWGAADQLGYPFGAIVKMLLLCPQRRMEVGGMSFAEVDMGARLWTIPAERSKNKLPLEVPLSDAALALVQSFEKIGDSGLCFPGRTDGRPVGDWSELKDQIDALAGAANWKQDWRLHDCRRTIRTRLSAMGFDPELCERVLGHVPGGVRQNYDVHTYREEKRKILQAWADALRSIVEKKPVLSAAA